MCVSLSVCVRACVSVFMCAYVYVFVSVLYEKVKPNNHGDIMGGSFEFYYVVQFCMKK